MNRETAIGLAQAALVSFLHYGDESCSIRLDRYEGRWNIYSFRIAQWFIQLSDNGGRLVYINDVAGQPSYFE